MKIIDYEDIRDEHVKRIQVGKSVKERNQELSNDLHSFLVEKGIKSINVMGSVGAGKTSIIEMLAEHLKNKYQIAVINGDLATTIDADRVKKHGVEVVQIQTGRMCHLDAVLVRTALEKFDLEKIDLLIIENVGNLICPADFPVGSDQNLIVTSVTEGPYMVIKHPIMFHQADVVIINKTDLADSMQVDLNQFEQDILSIKPNIPVIKTNGRTGDGIDRVIQALGL